MKLKLLLVAFPALLSIAACSQTAEDLINEDIAFACRQIDGAICTIEESGEVFLNPISTDEEGNVRYCDYRDWRSGFFPGNVWLLYELTRDAGYLETAKKYSEAIKEVQFITDNHDVGFMTMCSFGNGLRLTGEKEYKDIIVQSARSLVTRFHEVPGLIQSWESSEPLDFKYPVIIDNMMNLELLFKAYELTGEQTFYDIAVKHADRTLEEQFRPDGSCYHVIDYDPETGEVRRRTTHQGYSDDSIWSRGQAWAIYAFAMMYVKTADRKYLEQSLKTFEMMKNHPDMPEDCVPYWDMCAPDIPNEPRDASSAAIIASALYMISTLDVDSPEQYSEYADRIMCSLSSPAYRAKTGENGNFILMHSVGSKPHNGEIDKPMGYADYYYLEALSRKKSTMFF